MQSDGKLICACPMRGKKINLEKVANLNVCLCHYFQIALHHLTWAVLCCWLPWCHVPGRLKGGGAHTATCWDVGSSTTLAAAVDQQHKRRGGRGGWRGSLHMIRAVHARNGGSLLVRGTTWRMRFECFMTSQITVETLSSQAAADLPASTGSTVFNVMPAEWLWHTSQSLAWVESTVVTWSFSISK